MQTENMDQKYGSPSMRKIIPVSESTIPQNIPEIVDVPNYTNDLPGMQYNSFFGEGISGINTKCKGICDMNPRQLFIKKSSTVLYRLDTISHYKPAFATKKDVLIVLASSISIEICFLTGKVKMCQQLVKTRHLLYRDFMS